MFDECQGGVKKIVTGIIFVKTFFARPWDAKANIVGLRKGIKSRPTGKLQKGARYQKKKNS